jgi:uncharacterized protein YdhG (YjbR/CyaY superfamily)
MATVIERQVKGLAPVQRETLLRVRDSLRELLPLAEEGIAWGMPCFTSAGVALICFQGFKKHNSIFPMSGQVPALLAKELSGYQVSKGTIQFALDKAMPKPLLRKILEVRIAELNAGYPKKSGEYLNFYANGVLQSRGRYKGDAMHGAWEFFRKDGSIMRSGSFKEGVQTGEWVTYDREGGVVKTTRF